MNIRKVCPEDAIAICRIYNYYVEHTSVTFEADVVTEEEIRRRIGEFVAAGFPYYVAEIEGGIVGYTYMHQWNPRAAYSATWEITIYLDSEKKGKGYGTALYEYLFSTLDPLKVHVVLAGICIPNEASRHLHEKFGLRQVSHMKEVGWKFGAWHDVGHWQTILKK
ncbi:MAG: N-acetyltransferase family protein [Tannerellaceae bacterium]|nr:N-acetyltransferase family protein [Tannerellaceae bacterium]